MFFEPYFLTSFVLGSLFCLLFNGLNVDCQCICGIFEQYNSTNILNCNVSDSELLMAKSTIIVDGRLRCANVTHVKLSLCSAESTDIADGCFAEFHKLDGLSFRTGNFPKLQRKQFTGLTSLRHFTFEYDAKIESVEEAAFEDVKKLEKLKLSNVKHLAANSLANYENLQQLYIYSEPSTDISADLSTINLPSLSELKISYGSSTNVLDLDVFSTTNLSSLNHLTMSGCSFRAIHINETNWSMFENLQHLFLNNNQFKYLHLNSFSGLTKLLSLHLENNQISEFSTDIWRDLSNLRKLQLSNNDLSSLTTNAFQRLTNLKELYLSNNRIKHFSSSDWPKNIQLLTLSGNEIATLNSNQFSNLNSLESLHVNNNKIEKIIGCTFCYGLNQLRILSIFGNPLKNHLREEFDGLLNSDLVIRIDNGTLRGPMNRCSEDCLKRKPKPPASVSIE